MQYVDPQLPRHIFGWTSPRLGLHMPIVHYGDRGHPLLVFPTAQADFLENERFFLIKSIEPLIFAGHVQVFSIDSINRYAWMNDEVAVPEQARRQRLYASYVEEEVVPFIHHAVGRPARICTTGASFGAFHAANQFFRRPDLFDSVIAMSGFYNLIPGYTQGFMNDDVYFNNPMSYMRNLEGGQLDLLRHHTDIHVVTGQGAYEAPHKSKELSQLLWDRGIWHDLDLWGHDVDHDWPWWRRMLPFFLADKVRW